MAMEAYYGDNPCPWTKFYLHATHMLDKLFDQPCSPHEKIAKFITAAKRRFAEQPNKSKKFQHKVKTQGKSQQATER